MQQLSDDERRELVEWLRASAPEWTVSGRQVLRAANEIERQAAEVRRLKDELELAQDERRFASD